MKTKRLLLCGCVAAAFGLAAFRMFDREPRYENKPLSEWIWLYFDEAREARFGVEARDAIRHMGKRALPYLLKWIEEDEPAWRKKLRLNLEWRLSRSLQTNFLIRPLLMAQTIDVQTIDRARFATVAFKALGPAASNVIPQLAIQMGKPPRGWHADNAMRALLYTRCPAALPPLLAVATNTSEDVAYRYKVITSLSQLGTNAFPAIPHLIAILSDDDPQLASAVISSLCDLRFEPKLVMPALIKTLQATSEVREAESIYQLDAFGEEARPVVPAIQWLINSRQMELRELREAITNALLEINPEVLTNHVQTSHAGLGKDIPQTNRLILESGDWIPGSGETQKALLAIQSFLETLPSPTGSFAEQDSAKEILEKTKGYGVRFIGKLREGRKVIVCNFFPAPKSGRDHLKKLQQEGLWVDGGGSSYWEVDYEPSTGRCLNFTCHAPE